MRVLLQAGHYPSGGGAPGEAAWAFDLAHRIASRLEAQGVEVAVIGDFLNQPAPPQCAEDWALFVALHYDADIYPNRTGCFADRALNDPMGAESDRAIAAWEAAYLPATGIPLHNERRNANTNQYYAFRATTANTPGILIEHGVGQGLDQTILFDGIDFVADADAAAIFDFLGVVPVPPEPEPPADPCEVPNKIKAQLERFVRELQPRQTPWVASTKRAAKKAGMTWADYLITLAQQK